MSKWYETAIFFQMYPFSMVGAPKVNTQDFTSDNFPELENWLAHLEDIGVNAIYIGPLFESSTHGYDTKDYYLVDKRLGSNNSFKHFVDTCHTHNIKVVVDGVFNHSGKDFFAFKDLLENKENSPYRYWYKDVDFSRQAPSGEPFYFAAWRNIHELANLNLDNYEVKNYLLDVISFWIKEFKIDGIRLDCADCLSFDFIKEMRIRTNKEKEDFWLMGELIHGDYSQWINPDMLNSSTNYELHKALYSSHNDHNYFEIAHSIKRQFDEREGIYKGMFLYSFVDNHDVDRIASKLNNKAHLILTHVLLYTLPTIPSIYYGSQWGIEGVRSNHSDEALRPKLDPIYMNEHNPHPELTSLIKQLCKLKKDYPELSYGKYKELYLTNRQYAYARISNEDIIIVCLNNDDNECTLNIPCPLNKEKAINLLNDETFKMESNNIIITLQANEAKILKCK